MVAVQQFVVPVMQRLLGDVALGDDRGGDGLLEGDRRHGYGLADDRAVVVEIVRVRIRGQVVQAEMGGMLEAVMMERDRFGVMMVVVMVVERGRQVDRFRVGYRDRGVMCIRNRGGMRNSDRSCVILMSQREVMARVAQTQAQAQAEKAALVLFGLFGACYSHCCAQN